MGTLSLKNFINFIFLFCHISVVNYTKIGYAKIPVPKELWNFLHNFYMKNQGQDIWEYPEYKITPYHNSWDARTRLLSIKNESLVGGGSALVDQIWRLARPILQEWTNQHLVPVSIYGIRIYQNQSILTPHVDRMPLIISAIINVDQNVDEPWPLEVFDHTGQAINVTMKPGEMVSMCFFVFY